MHRSEHIKRIDFSIACCNSDGDPITGTEEEIVVLFNDTIISIEEVNKLINSGMYEYDERVVTMSKTQADNLAGFSREEASLMQQFTNSEEMLSALKDLKDEIIEEIRHSTDSLTTEKLNTLYKEIKNEVKEFVDENFYNNARKYNELLKSFNEILNND